MELLLKLGAKVNALDEKGQTALHRCAREGNVQACRILLSYGADTTIVSLQVCLNTNRYCKSTTKYKFVLRAIRLLNLLLSLLQSFSLKSPHPYLELMLNIRFLF